MMLGPEAALFGAKKRVKLPAQALGPMCFSVPAVSRRNTCHLKTPTTTSKSAGRKYITSTWLTTVSTNSSPFVLLQTGLTLYELARSVGAPTSIPLSKRLTGSGRLSVHGRSQRITLTSAKLTSHHRWSWPLSAGYRHIDHPRPTVLINLLAVVPR